MDDKQAAHRIDSVKTYSAPLIERVLTAEDLEREIQYAGAAQQASAAF